MCWTAKQRSARRTERASRPSCGYRNRTIAYPVAQAIRVFRQDGFPRFGCGTSDQNRTRGWVTARHSFCGWLAARLKAVSFTNHERSPSTSPSTSLRPSAKEGKVRGWAAEVGCGSPHGSKIDQYCPNYSQTSITLRPSLYNSSGQGLILSPVNQLRLKENEE